MVLDVCPAYCHPNHKTNDRSDSKDEPGFQLAFRRRRRSKEKREENKKEVEALTKKVFHELTFLTHIPILRIKIRRYGSTHLTARITWTKGVSLLDQS
jgi:hypothetical protein